MGLAPDEKRLAIEVFDKGAGDLWLLDIARNTTTRFTFNPAWDFAPVWSPDSNQIVFSSTRDGLPNLYVKPASGGSDEELLLKTGTTKTPTDWSADGKFILYSERNSQGKFDLSVLPLEGDRMPRPFLRDEFDKGGAKFSPDGKWIAYASDESGQKQIYVKPFPGPGEKYQVSISGGINPRWRADGRELFFINADGKLMAVAIKAGPRFATGLPQALFDTHIRRFGSRTNYVASRDGQRFLNNDVTDVSTSAPITVVLNWTADLKR